MQPCWLYHQHFWHWAVGKAVTDLRDAASFSSVILFQASREQNVPKEQLYNTVQRMLDEIGYNRQLPVIRWLGLLLLKVLKRTRSSICVNESSINRVSCNWTCLGTRIARSLISQLQWVFQRCWDVSVPCHVQNIAVHMRHSPKDYQPMDGM